MIKTALKTFLPSTAVRWLREWKDELLDVYCIRSYSQEGEDGILSRLFDGKHAGFYVDVGAHHPKRFSNTYRFYAQGWRGINVDPNPDAMCLFKRWRKRDINITTGVSDTEGELTYYMFNEPALNSFDGKLSRQRQNGTHRIVDTLRVKVNTLARILETYLPAGTSIDFLSIDVEGYDLNVIKSNDWSRFRPACVLVEVLGIDLEDMPRHPIHRFLSEKMYRLHAKTVNTAFYLDKRSDGESPT